MDVPGPVEEAAAPSSTPTSQVELAVLAAAAAAAATPAPADDTPAPATSCKPDGAHSASSSSADGDGSTEPSGRGYSSSSEDEEADLAAVIARLKQVLPVSQDAEVQLAKPSALPSFDLAGVAALIKAGAAKRVICMCGAGISVSAGIPDFRSPGTGLYHRLEHYGLPHPHAVFELDYFRRNPKPFFLLAKELFPGNYLPTPTHHFMRLLHDKGLLLRCFTQNIDSLEHQAGLPADAVVAAHGNFDSARCIKCGMPHDVEHVRAAVFQQDGNPCYCKKKSCGGLVKPDIVFFGEALPERFWERVPLDFSEADLLIVMGTSLVVNPFAGLIDYVGHHVPRLLINRERAGELTDGMRSLGYSRGFNWGEGNYRDALFLGDCDAGVKELCRLLGWEADLDALIADSRSRYHPAAHTEAAEAQEKAGQEATLEAAAAADDAAAALAALKVGE